jgi:hypothetical protein
MYSPDRPNARSRSFIKAAEERLDDWRRNLPAQLKLEKPHLPAYSPPANIVILKWVLLKVRADHSLLYYALRILIYRPLFTLDGQPAVVTDALEKCRAATMATHDILTIWGKTFGHFCHHYLFLYCCFVSA